MHVIVDDSTALQKTEANFKSHYIHKRFFMQFSINDNDVSAKNNRKCHSIHLCRYSLRFGTKTSMRQPVAKVLETLHRSLSMIFFFWSPLHPLIKFLALQNNAQNLEKTTLNGRAGREVSIYIHRPVTSNDLKQERRCFRGSVLTFLQLVVALKQALHVGDVVKRQTRAPAKGDTWIQTRS